MTTRISLPLRQKILLIIAILGGLIILVGYNLKTFSYSTLQILILFYSLLIPFFLLSFETLIDLNKKHIFNIWLTIGTLNFIIYLLTKDGSINSLTSPLKTLLLFLIGYKILNEIKKKATGKYILNTYRQFSWNHDIEKRKISLMDVLLNILLFIIIFSSIIM